MIATASSIAEAVLSACAGQLKVTLPFPVSSRGSGRTSLDMHKTGKGARASSAPALGDDPLDDEAPVDLTDAPVDQVTLDTHSSPMQ